MAAKSPGSWGTPVKEVTTRIEAQLGAGKILAGFRFLPYPITEAEGLSDLPHVRLQQFLVDEEPQSRTASFARVTVTVQVAVEKTKGLSELAIAAQSVADALETDETSIVDGTVQQTTIRGITIRQNASGATGQAIHCSMDVVCETVPFNRAGRRSA